MNSSSLETCRRPKRIRRIYSALGSVSPYERNKKEHITLLTFYNARTSPNCLKTRIQLIDLNVEYEQVEVELPIGENT